MKTVRQIDVTIGCITRCILLLALAFAGSKAWGSATVLLEQPYGKLNIFAPAGHEAIYLDRVCAETPLKLRPCAVGELGAVISRYDGISNHDWVAMPLIPYLYAVTENDDIPLMMDKEKEIAMREVYRKRYLQLVAPDLPDGTAPKGNWYELVGSAFDRTIYGFRVNTSSEDDANLIAVFNDQLNVQRYNGLYRNCADFARTTINRVYPGSIKRNYVGDFGITSPKSVVRSLTHYAKKHPEIGLDVFMVPQVEGSLPRSHSVTDVSEGVLKRYSVPLVVLSPELEGVVLVAFVAHGRFKMPKDVEALDLNKLQADLELTQPFTVSPPAFPETKLPEVALQRREGIEPAGTADPQVRPIVLPAMLTPAAVEH
jgi:hypothetical protein